MIEAILLGIFIGLVIAVIIWVNCNSSKAVSIYFDINPAKDGAFWVLVDKKHKDDDYISKLHYQRFIKNNLIFSNIDSGELIKNSVAFDKLIKDFDIYYSTFDLTRPQIYFDVPIKYAKKNHIYYDKKYLHKYEEG